VASSRSYSNKIMGINARPRDPNLRCYNQICPENHLRPWRRLHPSANSQPSVESKTTRPERSCARLSLSSTQITPLGLGKSLGSGNNDLAVEQARQSLQQIPDENVYPPVTPGFTIVADDSDMAAYYIKRPKFLCLDDAEETKLLPKMLAEEANVLEALKPYAHGNLVKNHGCITARGKIVGLALEKYDVVLQYHFEDDPRELDSLACMRGLRAGIENLHSLGYAHKDLNPMNVAMDKDDRPVILDFGSCRKFGETLLSGGTLGWRDEDFGNSAAQHDVSALRRLEVWLEEKQREQRTGEASKILNRWS